MMSGRQMKWIEIEICSDWSTLHQRNLKTAFWSQHGNIPTKQHILELSGSLSYIKYRIRQSEYFYIHFYSLTDFLYNNIWMYHVTRAFSHLFIILAQCCCACSVFFFTSYPFHSVFLWAMVLQPLSMVLIMQDASPAPNSKQWHNNNHFCMLHSIPNKSGKFTGQWLITLQVRLLHVEPLPFYWSSLLPTFKKNHWKSNYVSFTLILFRGWHHISCH